MRTVCAWCDAPRGTGATCPKCGADYEKAARIKAGSQPTVAASSARPRDRQSRSDQRLLEAWEPVRDPAFEYQLTLWVIPVMLAVAFLMEILGVGDGLLRIVFGMPVHEFGHAVAGWFTGFNAVPTLWKTITPNDRGFLVPVVLFLGLFYLMNHARLNARGDLLLLGLVLLVLQFVGSLVLEKSTANVLITWGGDGLGMMLATALMAGFTLDKQTGWYAGYLRWGFALIGAAAFADMVTPWWVSLSDISAVPYGQTGGIHTDTYKLVNYHGWEMSEVINRYVSLSVVCGVILAFFQVRGIRQAARVVSLRNAESLRTSDDED